MPHPVFFHLLGVWLLLSHSPREAKAQGSNIVKLCGRELARARIEICGQINWGKAGRQGRGLPALPPVEVAPSPAPSTASQPMELASRRLLTRPSVQACPGSPLPHRLATSSAAQPGVRSPGEEEVTANKELGNIIQKRQSEAEDNSPAVVKNLSLDKHSQKKRMGSIELSNKCCHQGCTIRELARGC
ncbi:relaxin precursor [Loxodonta africana]|uniref:Relaxin n=1 Tax=Loxodonta africana TaxID=9785 RepID=B1AAP7_LOXAF|nr:relaxin precursor [Loxodonta africana]ACA13575.1 relaxin [Loxodonta africana]